MSNNYTFRVLFLLLLALLAGCREDRSIQDEVFYFVLPDRFQNGDPSNDTGQIPGGKEDHGLDPEDKAYFHGGDLQGLRDKLNYLKSMGITAIWMTPIFKNDATVNNSAGYHGYWTTDYTQVDPHLGTNDDLAGLIRDAHRMGIKVFFDIVVNHTADVIVYDECHNPDGSLKDGLSSCDYVPVDQDDPTRTPFIPAGEEDVKVPAWLNDIARYNNRGDSTFSGESSIKGDFFGLDDLNTQDPVVVEGMIDIFKFWISEFKIDGFRLDTVKHVDMSFWKQWAPAIQEHAVDEGLDDFFIFGEVFDGNPRVISRYTTEGKLPSALDFGLYYASKDVFAQNSAPSRLSGIYSDDDWYTDEDSHAGLLMNFVSNHDVGRIGRQIKEANPDETDEQHLARLKLSYALNFFGRGVPVIYYGDEQGFTGDEGDTGAREDMMPSLVEEFNDNDLIGTDSTTAEDNFDTLHPMFRTLRSYSMLYQRERGLRRGLMSIRYASNEPGIFAFSRVEREQPYEYLVVMNTATTEQEVTLAATGERYKQVYPRGSAVTAEDSQITVTVEPLSFKVFKSNQMIETPDIESVKLTLSSERKVSGRVPVTAEVTWEEEALLPLTGVRFEVKVNDGEFVDIGTDVTKDYAVFYNADQYEEGTQLTFRAVAGNTESETVYSEEVTVEVGIEPGMKVIFKKPDSWGNSINLYYWNADPAPAVSWPGVPTESLGNGWYSYQFPDGVQYGSLIFNDGQGNQTADLFRESDGCYIESAWQDTCEPDTEGGTDPVPGIVVYFERPADWANPFVYYWNAGAAGPEWPGAPMESLGDNWFKFQFPENTGSANLIFNSNGSQSADLFREESGCYNLENNTWTDSCAIPGFKVFMQKPDNWAGANAYFWNTTPASPGVDWPGVAMDDLGESWFSYQFSAGVTAANLILNSGDGQQTADLYREGNGCYDVLAESWSNDCNYPRPGLLVRFKKPESWADSVNVYYWNAGSAPGVDWPGMAATSLGEGWFEYQFPAGANAANLIFNDGNGQQTGDLYRTKDGCFGEYGEFWTDICLVP